VAFLLDTGSKAPRDVGARSSRAGEARPEIIALEPSDPSRNGMRRLRRALAKRCGLKHPNLVRTRVIGEGDGRIFLAFEDAGGRSLREAAGVEPFEPAGAARVLDGVAAGVTALGRSGLAAWDLSPEQVLVDPNHGARLMSAGVPAALIRRTSREDRGNAGEAGDDVRLLGSILFTALTGATAEAATGAGARRSGAPPRPSRLRPELSAAVDAVVMRALAPTPDERFANARALTQAFSAAVGSASGRAQGRVTVDAKKPKPKPAARAADDRATAPAHRKATLGKVVFAALLIALSAAAGIMLARASEPEEPPSSLTRAGVTIDLPEGWRAGEADLAGTALRSPIAATPAGDGAAGLVIGKLGSEAAAERIIGRSANAGEQVQLGDLYALRYEGLRPGPATWCPPARGRCSFCATRRGRR
jgi:hypothetical protein